MPRARCPRSQLLLPGTRETAQSPRAEPVLFSQIADGVDDETWLHHLRQGDYSAWMRVAIKDQDLADEVRAIEAEAAGSAAESRRRIRAAIADRYTLPAEGAV